MSHLWTPFGQLRKKKKNPYATLLCSFPEFTLDSWRNLKILMKNGIKGLACCKKHVKSMYMSIIFCYSFLLFPLTEFQSHGFYGTVSIFFQFSISKYLQSIEEKNRKHGIEYIRWINKWWWVKQEEIQLNIACENSLEYVSCCSEKHKSKFEATKLGKILDDLLKNINC